MNKKKADIFLISGLAINLLLILFFIFIYFYTNPKDEDLKSFSVPRVPDIENPEVESIIGKLKKVDELPIYVDPTEVGKVNPYN